MASEDIITRGHHSLGAALLGGTLAAVSPALAADVTPDRLVNADREPQNWLMKHRTYDGQRFSSLARAIPGSPVGKLGRSASRLSRTRSLLVA